MFKGVFGTEWCEGYEELVDNITKNNDEPIDESDFEMFIDNRNSEVIVTSRDFDKTLISHSFELNGNIYNFETLPE